MSECLVPIRGSRRPLFVGAIGTLAISAISAISAANPPFQYPPFDLNVNFQCTTVSLGSQAIPVGRYVGYSVSFVWSAPAFATAHSDGAIWKMLDQPASFFGCPFIATVYADPGPAPQSSHSGQTVTLAWRGRFLTPYIGGQPLHLAHSQDGLTANWGTVSITLYPEPCSVADVCGIGGPTEFPDGQLTGDDFVAFINAFAAGESLADVCGIGGPPAPSDGLITGDDFVAFINGFVAGCP